MQRYFVEGPLKINQILSLSAEIQKHWLKVMRAKVDDQAEFVDEVNHRAFIGKLINVDDNPQVKIITALNHDPELPYQITIACGLPKKDKADLITMKATELGVDHIIFFPSAWSIAKWKANRIDKKLSRLNTIAKNAAQQSHRTVIPKITYVNSLEAVVAQPFDFKVVAYEESGKHNETSALKRVVEQMNVHSSLLALFGPEGGIAPAEIEKMNQAGVISVGLGPRILRTETAPLYLLSAISAFSELN